MIRRTANLKNNSGRELLLYPPLMKYLKTFHQQTIRWENIVKEEVQNIRIHIEQFV